MIKNNSIKFFMRYLKEKNCYNAYIKNLILDSGYNFNFNNIKIYGFFSTAFRWKNENNILNWKVWMNLDDEWGKIINNENFKKEIINF